METTPTAVETTVQPAAPVQSDPQPAITVDPTIDYAKIIAEKDAELAQIAKDRDNYKAGLLIAKGKLPPVEDPIIEQPNVATLVQEEVQKALFAQKEMQLLAEKEALLNKVLLENKELKTALSNKQGISTSGTGTSADNNVTTEQFFTAEQLDYFKKRGIDPNKVKANYLNKVK